MKKKSAEQESFISPESAEALDIPPCYCGAAAELVHFSRTDVRGPIHFYGVKCSKGHRIPTAFGSPKGAVKFWSETLNNHR